MWPKTNNTIIAFLLTPYARTAALFTPTAGPKQFTLTALEIDDQIDNARQHNIEHCPEKFKLFSQSFIKKNKIKNAFVAYALSHHGITEGLIQHHTSSPKKNTIYDPSLQNNQWKSTYLCPSNNGQFLFYRVGIPRPLLFQYKLLATACSHNLIRLTTEFEAHLTLYQYIRGSAFRQSQLAHDLERHNYQLDSLLDPDMFRRLLHIPDQAYQTPSRHTASIITLFGLYLDTYLNDIKREK